MSQHNPNARPVHDTLRGEHPDTESVPAPALDDREREEAILLYARALDRGDGEGIARALDLALHDAELDRLLGEVDAALAEEHGLSPLGTDAARVRQLLRLHLPSAFEEEDLSPDLTVGEVASRLHSEWGADRGVAPADREAARQLLTDGTLVPASLSRPRLEDLARSLAGRLPAPVSPRFWKRFKDAATIMSLRRTTPQAQLALARTEKSQFSTSRPSSVERSSQTSTLTRIEQIEAAVHEVWDEAGLAPDAVRGVVPLDSLIPYNLCLIEVPDLTYKIAAAEIQRELGRTLATGQDVNRSLAGFLYAETNGGLILVKKQDAVVRRRFSVAHELGHFKLHRVEGALVLTEALFDPTTKYLPQEVEPLAGALEAAPDEEIKLPLGLLSMQAGDAAPGASRMPAGTEELARMEREANAFAARLLMPEPLCRRLLSEHRARFGPRTEGDDVAVRRLASQMLVSPEAMRYRLRDLGLISAKAPKSSSRRRA